MSHCTIATGHPDQAPAAIVNLGVLLEERGDGAGAEAAYREAITPAEALQRLLSEPGTPIVATTA